MNLLQDELNAKDEFCYTKTSCETEGDSLNAVFLPPFLSLVFYLASLSVLLTALLAKSLLKHGKTVSFDDPKLLKFHISKSLFRHFYTIGTLWTLFLPALIPAVFVPLESYLTSQKLFDDLKHIQTAASLPVIASHQETDAFVITAIVYICLLVQLTRRWSEACHSSSSGTMHVFHYFAGLGFYLGMPLAYLYIPLLYKAKNLPIFFSVLLSSLSPSQYLRIILPIIQKRTVSAALALFWASWIIQYQSHSYLSTLKIQDSKKDTKPSQRYRLPNRGLFQWVTNPHYMAEIGMFSSLTFLSLQSPLSRYHLDLTAHLPLNEALFQYTAVIFSCPEISVVVWTIVILSISARETWKYYRQTYGPQSPKYCLLPLIF